MTQEEKQILQRTENLKDQRLSFPKFICYFQKGVPSKFQQPGDKILAKSHI